jgi:putative colanic acid biosynthesis acetyltransferase WcaF
MLHPPEPAPGAPLCVAPAGAAPAPVEHALPANHPHRRATHGTGHRAARALWGLAWLLLARASPRPAHAWRALLLRLFGARLGPGCHVYPAARIWAPWNLRCGTGVAIADGAEVYNPALVEIGDYAVISQQAFLCAATHDIDDPAFPLVARPIRVGARAWIAARATVAAGVVVGEGAVLGACGLATRPLNAWTVYAGVPARPVRRRRGGDAV